MPIPEPPDVGESIGKRLVALPRLFFWVFFQTRLRLIPILLVASYLATLGDSLTLLLASMVSVWGYGAAMGITYALSPTRFERIFIGVPLNVRSVWLRLLCGACGAFIAFRLPEFIRLMVEFL